MEITKENRRFNFQGKKATVSAKLSVGQGFGALAQPDLKPL